MPAATEFYGFENSDNSNYASLEYADLGWLGARVRRLGTGDLLNRSTGSADYGLICEALCNYVYEEKDVFFRVLDQIGVSQKVLENASEEIGSYDWNRICEVFENIGYSLNMRFELSDEFEDDSGEAIIDLGITLEATKIVKPETKPEPKKDQKMNKLEQLANTNKSAVVTAVTLEGGRIINKAIIKQIKPHLPVMVRGLSDHVLFEVLTANVAVFAVDQYMPGNAKAKALANAALISATQSFMQTFDFEGMLNKALSGVSLPKGFTDQIKAEIADAEGVENAAEFLSK